ncbi:hypothetical protein KUTeg_003304 [Tegillarca granosa]|uniref:GRAM domain-containing protein n=1 Tax=Tegillarca granosa TaxID=220873 RepID=A0ABQ9FLT3_TEGGR|nr:hypothetical protein KUTeg_003304 [Tegillarca granosa]
MKIMSLNTAHAHGGVVIYNGERILLYCDGVEFALDGAVPAFKGNKKGRIYLTTHRVIFTNKDFKALLQSFSIPFYCMKEVELEQPVFGANYIKGRVVAEEGGNWTGSCKFKLWFNSGGCIEFGQAMLRAGQLASRNRMQQPPPPYVPPQGPYYQAPPSNYAAPQNYAWVPYQTFPSAPPPEYVYMTEAPPPYPGVDPNYTPYPPPPQHNGHMSAADAKAQEANNSAYYNPATPHNVYVPATASAPPPPYSEFEKKNN